MRFSSIFFLMLAISCNKKSDYVNIQIIGHAGMGLDIPTSMYHDNSKEAIEYALSMNGCNGVEVDVQISKDGQLWLYHDPVLDSQTNTSGCIFYKTSDELSHIQYSSWHHEKLTQLNDLNPILLLGKTLYLDLRNFESCNNTFIETSLLVNALNQVQYLKNNEIEVIVISSDINFLKLVQLAGYNTALEMNDPNNIASVYTQFPELKEVIVKNQSISKDKVVSIQKMGIKVTLFEMRSASGIRKALNKFPHSIITDDLRESIIEVY